MPRIEYFPKQRGYARGAATGHRTGWAACAEFARVVAA